MDTRTVGDAEYAAAVVGMQDTYGRPRPATGDFVGGFTGGKRWSGTVEWTDGDRVTVDVGGGWVAVSLHDITYCRTDGKRS
jgi:hypothetical protein